MQTYLVQARYSSQAIASLIAKPEDRSQQVQKMCAELGGKLNAFYISFGDYDLAAIVELPNDEVAAGAAMGAMSHGYMSDFKTTRLFNAAEVKSALKYAQSARQHIAPPKGK